MKICFGILSSSTNGDIVDQLVGSLGNQPSVFVHHDYSQNPDFKLSSKNAVILKDYTKTDWGLWTQAEAIIGLLRYAVQNSSFDYFQLLSETCLPVRPISEFENFLTDTHPDACIGLIKVAGRADDLGTINYAWRCFSKNRIMRRIIAVLALQFSDQSGINDPSARDLFQGLSVIRVATVATKFMPLRRALFNLTLKVAQIGTPFSSKYDCYVGSTWFCLSRKMAEYVLDELDRNPKLIEHYRGTLSPDESIIHTVVGNKDDLQLFDINHFISWVDRANGPDELKMEHLGDILGSNKFFARKFSKDIKDPLRLKILDRVANNC